MTGPPPSPQVPVLRRARTGDVPGIRALVDTYAARRILLDKATVKLYEDLQEFWVATVGDTVAGCGALHVLWDDLAEVRSVAVAPDQVGRGIGHALLARLIETGRELGVARLFALTFEVEFFASHGFVEIEGTPVEPEVYAEMLQSYDEGVAEFLDLDRVKPNTLGNARMIMELG